MAFGSKGNAGRSDLLPGPGLLLSGWLMGGENIAGTDAVVEVPLRTGVCHPSLAWSPVPRPNLGDLRALFQTPFLFDDGGSGQREVGSSSLTRRS